MPTISAMLLLSFFSLPLLGAGPATTAESALVIFGADTVRADVADEHPERVKGLQDRREVPEGTGLLFVFEEAAERSFWMVDTLIDLDIAFMDEDFRITRIATMEAGSSELTDSLSPAMYALEVRAGWFDEKGIEVGSVAEVIFDPIP